MDKNELHSIKEQLLKRKQKVTEEIATLTNELEEMGTYENIEDIEDLAQLETLNDSDKALLTKLQKELKQIIKALRKIDEGTYGECEDGSEIPIEKLKADPLYEC